MEKQIIKFEYDPLNNEMKVDIVCDQRILLNAATVLGVRLIKDAPQELRGPAICALIHGILDEIEDVDIYDIASILNLSLEGNENEK